MATLVLSVAGGLIGGPIGAAVGGAIGGVLDREVLFRTKGREGPRLSELKLQTSSYGTQIPKLFGTMRVAGSVIWATDLVEHRSSSGGKGRPSVTSYSYTASFAVALSARPVLGVGRIWADGKLLRGAAGDFKARTGFRLHAGGEDQAPDPLIVAAEGAALAPAHRGIAYAVFEDLELADFGNRIPALSFELFADPGPLAAGAIAEMLGEGSVTSPDATPALAGFAAQGASVRAVLETLAGAAGSWFVPNANGIELASGPGPATEIADAGAGGRRRGPRGARSIKAADAAPRTLSLAHYDPARDYQIGVQRAARPGAGQVEARVELPAAIEAGAARTIAEAALGRADLERERRRVALGWDALDIGPGARVRIAGAAGLWRVERWSLEDMVVALECLPIAPAALALEASGGRVLGAPDLVPGATIVHAFELPPLDDAPATVPRLAVAAAGTGTGWRRAALLLSTDGGAQWDEAGGTAAPAVLGRVTTPPGPGSALIEDRVNHLEVVLAHAAMLLADADAARIDGGANLAMIGDELIQFARAEPLGAGRWRLSQLWRGRRGTEGAIGTQRAGDRFVLLDAAALALRDLPPTALGGIAQVLAEGAGDAAAPAGATARITGISALPPAPVHLRAEPQPEGGTRLRWVRRSRTGWRWADGIDAPLGEEAERYRISLVPADAPPWTVETVVSELLLGAAERASALFVEVRQIGSLGASPPARIALPPWEKADGRNHAAPRAAAARGGTGAKGNVP